MLPSDLTLSALRFILAAKSRQSCKQDFETVDFCNSLKKTLERLPKQRYNSAEVRHLFKRTTKVVKELENFSKSEEIGVYRSYQSGRSGSEVSDSYQDEWQSPLNHDAVTFDTTDAPTVCVRAVRPYISLLVLLYCSERSSARNEPCTAAADYWSHLATCEICGVEVSVGLRI